MAVVMVQENVAVRPMRNSSGRKMASQPRVIGPRDRGFGGGINPKL